MDNSKIYMKITFNGEKRYFVFKRTTRFEEICSCVLQRFEVPKHYLKNMVFLTQDDFMFTKDVMEYYLTLFPMPKTSFFLYFIGTVKGDEKNQSARLPFGKSALENSNTKEQKSREPRHVAVHRQNCFIGNVPDSNNPVASKRQRRRHHDVNFKASKSTRTMRL